MLIACVLVFAGTAGFTTVDAERAVSVETVGDENAYMALIYDDTKDIEESDTATYLTVRNQFSETVDATVAAEVETDNGLSVSIEELHNEEVGIGTERELTAEFECQSAGRSTKMATITFDSRFKGDSVLVETDASRTVRIEVQCEQDNSGGNGDNNSQNDNNSSDD
jgi:hypothetical protein